MEEQIVSLKVAKLLEEHNFCNGSSHYYSNIFSEQLHKNDDGVLYLNGLDVNYIEAPTQSLAQRWLRDKHGFFVLVELDSIGLYPHIYRRHIIPLDKLTVNKEGIVELDKVTDYGTHNYYA